MRLSYLLALTFVCRGQDWASVQAIEGSRLFHLLHGQYISLDLPLNPTTSGPTVSFSPQGATVLTDQAGRKLRGIGIDALLICSPDNFPVRGGDVYQTASRLGISWISPSLAASPFRKSAALSAPNLLLSGATYATLAIPIAGQVGLIAMTSKVVVGLLAGHALFDSFKSQIQTQVPDPTALLSSLLDPEAVLTFSGGCRESRMIVGYHKNPVSGTFPVQ